MWLLRITAQPPFPPAAVYRIGEAGQRLVLGHADDEQARPGLWHGVVRRVEHLRIEVIPGRVYLAQQTVECWLAGFIVVGEGVDVLQYEPPWPGLGEDACVLLQERCVRVEALALPLQPEARLGERRARRPADQQVRPRSFAQASGVQDLTSWCGHDVGLDDRRDQMAEVLLHRRGGVTVPLDRGPDLIACVLGSKVQAASAGEERDCNALGTHKDDPPSTW